MSEDEAGYQSENHRRLIHLLFVVTASFGAVAMMLVYWGVVQAGFLNARSDNPRNIEQTLRIRRGAIVDTQEIVLAFNGGTTARQERIYPLPAAEPVIGYYSVRHGTAGVEEALDDVLTGANNDQWDNHWRSVLNQPQVGQDVRLTVDIALQANAAQLLENKRGAAILMGIPGGAIRVMASMPTYDPNTLDEAFDQLVDQEAAPLLNRAAQGAYQPGEILLPFLVAAALDKGDLIGSELIDDGLTAEQIVPRLERRWVGADLQRAWALFGFDQAPALPLPVVDPAGLAVDDFEKAIVGEDAFTVTPLQVALAAAILGNDGMAVNPQLVSAVRQGERWQAFNQTETTALQIIQLETARQIIDLLPISEENVVEWETSVQSGPQSYTSWYVALFPASDPRFVTVVVLEDEDDSRFAREIGRRLLLLSLK